MCGIEKCWISAGRQVFVSLEVFLDHKVVVDREVFVEPLNLDDEGAAENLAAIVLGHYSILERARNVVEVKVVTTMLSVLVVLVKILVVAGEFLSLFAKHDDEKAQRKLLQYPFCSVSKIQLPLLCLRLYQLRRQLSLPLILPYQKEMVHLWTLVWLAQ